MSQHTTFVNIWFVFSVTELAPLLRRCGEIPLIAASSLDLIVTSKIYGNIIVCFRCNMQ
jgi:hypothetical protein